MDANAVQTNIDIISQDFAVQRHERLQRTKLQQEDFSRLTEAGLNLTGVPDTNGGFWQSLQKSSRLCCNLIRKLAQGDPSVALVASMHPSVLTFWLCQPSVPEPYSDTWCKQREQVFAWVNAGHWFGTIASEPGSGGDLSATRAVARLDDDGSYRLSGDKHMGSGSGITSFMITTARIEDETNPDLFLIDTRNLLWDNSSGAKLVREWDGYGMMATQSHAFSYQDLPVVRSAWPGHVLDLVTPAVVLAGCLFTAVTVGILDSAVSEARRRLTPRAELLKAFEQTEWTRAVNEHWLVLQVFEGMLRAVESEGDATVAVNRGKTMIAEFAETIMQRLARVIGGSSLARPSPFGQWLQDVRAIGFLRPPWPLAYEKLFEASWSSS